MTDDDLLILGRQHTLQSGLDFVDGVVNHPVHPHIYLSPLGAGLGGGVGTDVEADDNGVGCGGQKNVGFVHGAHAGVDHLDPDLVVAQLQEAGLQSFGRALDVGLHDEVQVLHLSLLHHGEEVVQSDLGVELGGGVLLRLAALLHQLSGHALVGDGVEFVARGGDIGQTGDFHRDGGTGGLYGAALVVGHHPNAAHGGAGNDHIALVQGAVLDQEGGDGTPGPVHAQGDRLLRG